MPTIVDDRPLLYDLFCGAGGAAMGYYNAGFRVVGVDLHPQKNYPFDFIQMDALAFLQEIIDGTRPRPDVIHASPPCQAYVDYHKTPINSGHPQLIEPTRELMASVGVIHIIENVDRAPLFNPITLCGTQFNLLVIRHRLFESSAQISNDRRHNHWGTVAEGDFAAVYGRGGHGPRRGRDSHGEKMRDVKPLNAGPSWEIAMGIDWMTKQELTQAIPPAYTEFIGKQLMQVL